MQRVLQTYSATPTSPNLMRPIIEKPGGPLLYHETDAWAKNVRVRVGDIVEVSLT